MTYTYDGCCGSCVYMNTNDYVRHKDHCRCTYREQYYNLTEKKCQYYRYDPNKDYYDLNHRWHVVAAVLDILHTDATAEGIPLLARFRVDELEKEPAYEEVLRAYDVIGPYLARQLSMDPNAETAARLLLMYRLKPIEKLIEDGHNEQALEQYAEMIGELTERYYERFVEYCAVKRIDPISLRML